MGMFVYSNKELGSKNIYKSLLSNYLNGLNFTELKISSSFMPLMIPSHA